MAHVWTVFLFALGLAGVIRGGDWFVEKAVWFAKLLKIPEVILGATVVSLGTTLPETMISVLAASTERGEIVIGTAVGSILCNTGLILGLSVLIRPIAVRTSASMIQTISALTALAVLWYLSADGAIGRSDTIVLLVLLAVFLSYNAWSGLNGDKPTQPEKGDAQAIARNLVIFVLGLLFVVGGARLLLDSGVTIARLLGIPEALIAVTLFAVGSSLPELVTAISAGLKGYNHLLLGNILGANILNILMVVSVSSLVRPFSVDRDILQVQLPAAAALLSILILPSFFTKKITRTQGLVAFLGYASLIVFLILQSRP